MSWSSEKLPRKNLQQLADQLVGRTIVAFVVTDEQVNEFDLILDNGVKLEVTHRGDDMSCIDLIVEGEDGRFDVI